MNMNGVVAKLAKGEVVKIRNGETTIKKKLSSIIGGVPVYDLEVSCGGIFVKDIKDINELKTGAMIQDIPTMIVCSECGEIIEGDYYINEEEDIAYCGYRCLEKWMNEKFGENNWRNKDFSLDAFQIRVSEEEARTLDCVVKDFGEWWRDYDITCMVGRFKGNTGNVFEDLGIIPEAECEECE